MPVFGHRIVVLGLIDQLAPPIVNKQLVVPISVGVFHVDVGVEVLNGEDIVQVIAVRGDDIRKNKVVFDDYSVRDFTGATESAVDGKRYVVVTPGSVGVRGGSFRGICIPVTKVP